MKKRTCVLMLTLCLVAPVASQAQVVVEDPAQIANTLQQITYMTQQLEQLKQQLATEKQMFQSLSGSSGLGGLLGNSTGLLEQNLPADWQQVYADAMNNSSSISGGAGDMLNQFKNQIAGMEPGEALDYVHQQLQQKGAYDRVMAQKAYDNQMRELNDMEALTRQIDGTTSTKQIEDLQARIATAQGSIQGEQTKLQLMAMLQQSQDKMLQVQQEEAAKKYTVGDGNWASPDISN